MTRAPLTPRVEAWARTVPRSCACDLRELCVGYGPAADGTAAAEMVHACRRVRRGEFLYRAGDPFQFLFAIRSGFFTSRVVLENGSDQVTDFHMAGEMLGLDDIGARAYTSDVAALEYSEVYAIARFRLDEALMQGQLVTAMGRALARHRDMMMLLGSMRAAERLATFLLDLSRRLEAGGMSPGEFHLRMTRAEIGSYLGLSLETVSRLFSRFQASRLVEVQLRHVRLLDIAGLEAVGRGEVSLAGLDPRRA